MNAPETMDRREIEQKLAETSCALLGAVFIQAVEEAEANGSREIFLPYTEGVIRACYELWR